MYSSFGTYESPVPAAVVASAVDLVPSPENLSVKVSSY